MLGVVDNQLVHLEPVLNYQGGFRLVAHDGQLALLSALGPIEAGVRFYIMREDPGLDVKLDKVSGAFTVTQGYGLVRFRAVVGQEAYECKVLIERQESAA